jgi:hypothetical protein
MNPPSTRTTPQRPPRSDIFFFAALIALFLLVHKPLGKTLLESDPLFMREPVNRLNRLVAVDRKPENHVLIVLVHLSDLTAEGVYVISFFIFQRPKFP